MPPECSDSRWAARGSVFLSEFYDPHANATQPATKLVLSLLLLLLLLLLPAARRWWWAARGILKGWALICEETRCGRMSVFASLMWADCATSSTGLSFDEKFRW